MEMYTNLKSNNLYFSTLIKSRVMKCKIYV